MICLHDIFRSNAFYGNVNKIYILHECIFIRETTVGRVNSEIALILQLEQLLNIMHCIPLLP